MKPLNPSIFSQDYDNSISLTPRILENQRPPKLSSFSNTIFTPNASLTPRLSQSKLLPIRPSIVPQLTEKPSPLLFPAAVHKKATLSTSRSQPMLHHPFNQLDQSGNSYADQSQISNSPSSSSLRLSYHAQSPSSSSTLPKISKFSSVPNHVSEMNLRQKAKSLSFKNYEINSSTSRFEAHLEKQNQVLNHLLGTISKQEQIYKKERVLENQRLIKELELDKARTEFQLEQEKLKRAQIMEEMKQLQKNISPRKNSSETEELLFGLIFKKMRADNLQSLLSVSQEDEMSPLKSPRFLGSLTHSLSQKHLSQNLSDQTASTATEIGSLEITDETPSRSLKNNEPIHLFTGERLVEISPRVKSKTVLKKGRPSYQKSSGRRVTFGGNEIRSIPESS